jgi:hypothetical protein
MTRDSSTAPLAEAVALQGSVRLGGGAGGGAVEVQDPALAAVVPASPQHLQDAQPGATSAEEAQQQPPRHKLVPQSMLDPQASPGYRDTHAPLPAAQPLQPSCTAKGEQQTPPLQEPDAHAASALHAVPAAAAGLKALGSATVALSKNAFSPLFTSPQHPTAPLGRAPQKPHATYAT